jgi:hypothetical protein
MKEWRPRQPSAGLRSRIFASEAAGSVAVFSDPAFAWGGLMRWLVPAMGCFVLATASLRQPELRIPSGALEPLGRQQLAFSKASGHTSMNNVPVTNVEWTFGRSSSSNSDSFVRTETNTLIK